jgi:hypothetical protein
LEIPQENLQDKIKCKLARRRWNYSKLEHKIIFRTPQEREVEEKPSGGVLKVTEVQ